MALYLYKNGTWDWTGTPNKVTTPSLCYYQNNAVNYLPLITKTGSVTINKKKWSYTADVPTFHVIYNNTEYVVPNKVEAVMTYDIPAGTYDPDTFATLIASYISQNGSRTVSNSFTATVNSQPINVAAGTALTYTYQYSGRAKFVGFDGKLRGSIPFQNPGAFTTFKQYCVGWTYSSVQGELYKYHKITIGTGIKFK